MSDEPKLTQADIDKAVKEATESLKASIERLEAKNEELVGDVRKAKAEARAAKDITPEAHQAEVDRADKAEAALAEAAKQVKALTGERDKAVKALETEQTAARSYALDAEINAAIAAGNVVPALVPAFTAMVKQQAKADLADGKYSVTIADKPAGDYIKGFLDSDDGKHFKAAMANGGGGAPGGGGKGEAKTMTRSQFDALSHVERRDFAVGGGKVIDQAA